MTKATKINPTSFRFTATVKEALKRLAIAQCISQIAIVESLIIEAAGLLPTKRDK